MASYENPIRDSVERALHTGQPVTHTFKPAKRDYRRIIHELAEFYHCSSVSYDQEPHRNVVVTATKYVVAHIHIRIVKPILGT